MRLEEAEMKQTDVQDNADGKMVGGGGWKRREVLERAQLGRWTDLPFVFFWAEN